MTTPFPPPDAPAQAPEPDVSGLAREILDGRPPPAYRLRSCLGSWERGAVFKADDLTMDRTVAVKFVRPWPGRAGAVEDFFSLAGSIARLRCPGVARGLDAGRSGGDFFLVYEFLPGETLAARLARRQNGRLTEREVLRLAADVARVLRSLFELGHPHGHLKPSNIMTGEGGKIGLADIGFAWNVAWPDDADAYRENPDCLPPERIAGELNVDIRGDLYSLGAVLYRALLGTPVPCEDKTPSPRQADPKLTAATSELVMWLLENDRDARPRTPRDFLRRLKTHPLLAVAGEGEGSESGNEETRA